MSLDPNSKKNQNVSTTSSFRESLKNQFNLNGKKLWNKSPINSEKTDNTWKKASQFYQNVKKPNWESIKTVKTVHQIQNASKSGINQMAKTARTVKTLGVGVIGISLLFASGYFIRSCAELYKIIKKSDSEW